MDSTHSPPDTTRTGSLLGAILGAIAASVCCLGPLVLGLLGLGGAGALAALTAWRPYLLVGTVVLLAVGFWRTYRRPAVTPAAAGDACGCAHPRASRSGRAVLWGTTALVAAFAVSPSLIGALARAPAAPPASAASVADVILVGGMDCEGCAVPIRHAIERVGGVERVDVEVATKRVTVRHAPRTDLLARYVAAVNQLGYPARAEGRRAP